jgi:hypothetical protein
MYAISHVYEPEVPPQFSRRRTPLPPSPHVQLHPVPPIPRRAPVPQSSVQKQSMHPWMCPCDACQPTLPARREAPLSTRGEYRGSVSAHEPLSFQPAVSEPEQDLRTVLVPTILQRLRRSIEEHPLIWLGISYMVNLFSSTRR